MTTTREGLDTATAVLAFARDSRLAADRAEADVLVAAVTWAEQHPPESIHDAATWANRGGDCPLPLAGEGARRWWRSSASPSSLQPTVVPPMRDVRSSLTAWS